MTDTLRSILVTHPKTPNVTVRIGVFTPSVIGPDADKRESEAVIEIHARNSHGQQELVGTMTIDQFADFANEIIRIGHSVAPKKTSVDGDSQQ